MASSTKGSRLPVLGMLLALCGAAFWWYDGMVLLGPLLDGGVTLDLSALTSKVRAAERAPEPVAAEPVDEPTPSPASGEGSGEGSGDDPLARFGSWIEGSPLRQVFLPTRSLRVEAEGADGQAGQDQGSGGEGRPGAAAGPPPEHVVSVVMIADRERLAVVDGAVVAVGDQLEAGQVVEIHDGGLVVRGASGLLSYLIGSPRAHALRDDEPPPAAPREQP